jgi:phage repressor protein C with HTH and peptisase S24 domain
MLNNPNMGDYNGPTEASAMYDALMAVKPEGMSLNHWAQLAGINRSIFNGIRAHGNPTSKTLDRLLGAIGVDPAEFRARTGSVQTNVRGTGMSPTEVRQAWAIPEPAKRVPLLGTAFGSDLEEIEGVETTELMLSEVLDYVARPPSLANDAEAYAVTTIGDSMFPRFEPGEIAFVSPKATVNIGDDVLVQLRGAADEGEDNQLAGRISTVLLKRLVRRTSTHLELRQFNPDKTFLVPLKRVRRMHRVKGRIG